LSCDIVQTLIFLFFFYIFGQNYKQAQW